MISSLETGNKRDLYRVKIDELADDDIDAADAIVIDMAQDKTIKLSTAEFICTLMAKKLSGVKATSLIRDWKKAREDFEKDARGGVAEHEQMSLEINLTARQSQIAAWIAQHFEDEIAVDNGTKTFMQYHNGLWSVVGEINDPSVFNLIDEKVRAFGAEHNFGTGYDASLPKGVALFLAGKLNNERWNEMPNMIPFRNGVLSLAETGNAFGQHSPAYFFTWQLPFDYDEEAKCPSIDDFLSHATSDRRKRPVQEKIDRILATMRLMLSGDIGVYQKFLDIPGPPMSGKGTVIWMAEELVGQENLVSTTLVDLEKDKHEPSRFKGKRLLIVYDSDNDRVPGNKTRLQSLISGEFMSNNRKHQNANAKESSFRYRGAVIIAGNSPLTSDSMALLRRQALCYFHHVADKQEDMKTKLRPELPGLVNRVLALTEQQAIDILQKASEESGDEVKVDAMEYLLETNTLAAWAHDCLVYVPPRDDYAVNGWDTFRDGVNIGVKGEVRDNGTVTYLDSDSKLLPCFFNWAYQHNEKEAEKYSEKNFRNHLLRLLRDVRKLPGIEFDRTRYGSKIFGIKIREEHSSDSEYSPIAYSFGLVDKDGKQTDNHAVKPSSITI